MSHEIVKSIKILDGNVYIKSASNNVRPLTFSIWKAEGLTKTLNEKGIKALEEEILKTYEEGNFQGSGVKKYDNALKVLTAFFGEEYKRYSWKSNNFAWGSPEQKALDDLRTSPEFYAFLRKVLDFKPTEERFVIKRNGTYRAFFGKRTSANMIWKHDEVEATKYLTVEQAEKEILNFPYSNGWEVVKIRGF